MAAMAACVAETTHLNVGHEFGRQVVVLFRQPLYCFHFAPIVWLHVTEIGIYNLLYIYIYY